MLPDTLYVSSLLCGIVETLTLGLALLFIGNAKVAQSHHLKRVKLTFSIILILVGCTRALQWLLQLNTATSAAINITFVSTASFLVCLAFFPLASPSHHTTSRLLISIATLVVYNLILWVALTLFPTLFQIILFISTGLYFIELVRVIIVFYYNYKTKAYADPEPGSEEENHRICLNMVEHIFIVLSVCAILFVFFVVLTQKFKAIYYLAMIPVLGYLFVFTVNRIMSLNPLSITDINKDTPVIKHQEKTTLHDELSSKIGQWIQKGYYRIQGIKMSQVAQELSTNDVYLSQYISSHYGCNFKAWITGLRIDYAKQLLVTTSITIDMVASRSGFSNKAQFITAFKAQEGCTPGVWRERNLK